MLKARNCGVPSCHAGGKIARKVFAVDGGLDEAFLQ